MLLLILLLGKHINQLRPFTKALLNLMSIYRFWHLKRLGSTLNGDDSPSPEFQHRLDSARAWIDGEWCSNLRFKG